MYFFGINYQIHLLKHEQNLQEWSNLCVIITKSQKDMTASVQQYWGQLTVLLCHVTQCSTKKVKFL